MCLLCVAYLLQPEPNKCIIGVLRIVKESSEILPYLQVNKLGCYNFMDAGGRQKTHGSRERLYYHISSDCRINIFTGSLISSSPWVTSRGLGNKCTCSGPHSRRGTLNSENRNCSQLALYPFGLCYRGRYYLYNTERMHTCPLLHRETLSFKLFTI
jgi:hypothetical protein